MSLVGRVQRLEGRGDHTGGAGAAAERLAWLRHVLGSPRLYALASRLLDAVADAPYGDVEAAERLVAADPPASAAAAELGAERERWLAMRG